MASPTSQNGWHARSPAETLVALDSRFDGLTDREAAHRLETYGPNRLTPSRPMSALAILISQFRGVVVLLLVAAAALSLLLGDRVEAAGIAVVIALNAGIGFTIELRARRAMDAIQQLATARASVLREGQLQVVDADALVPGDVIELNAGQKVPADGRLIAETDLRTNEAALTGESLPISKQADMVLDDDTPLADRKNMVYRGTIAVAGTARVAVTATGDRTELGRVGTLTRSVSDEQTPLERRLDALGHRLVWIALGVATIVGALGIVQGESWDLMVETAIALAVAAVPEGLPAVATVALAIGLRRMARRHALVRRLPAVETLGSTTVVCTDKTRTLTSGEMAVARVWTSGGEIVLTGGGPADAATLASPIHALRVATRASRIQPDDPTADPVDLAIIRAATYAGIDPAELLSIPPVAVIPFSSERKFTAAFHRTDGHIVAYVKGAPARILAMTERVKRDGGSDVLDANKRAALAEVNRELAAEGLRVVGFASGCVSAPTEGALAGLTFGGFIGLLDPPAPGVRDALARLRQAGLRTIMLTGDQRATAEAIGRQLGLLSERDEAIDSRELRTLSLEALRERLPRTGTFSRIAPEDKLTIVRALQERGEIVAMLGDGINDAPALRKADVGVAMGVRGTDVAREAAAIVLQDDRFETIAAAVEEGRVIFDNIRKFVFYLFSCNLAEIAVLFVAGVAGLPLPLLPLQILWLNLVTDTFPALALAMEPGDPDVMIRGPRDPQEAILSRSFLLRVLLYGTLITLSTFTAFLWALRHHQMHATTIAFMTLALAQIFHLGNARSRLPVLRLSHAMSNRYAVGGALISIALQLAAMYITPIASVVRVSTLGLGEWTVVLVCSAVTAVVGQALRLSAGTGGAEAATTRTS